MLLEIEIPAVGKVKRATGHQSISFGDLCHSLWRVNLCDVDSEDHCCHNFPIYLVHAVDHVVLHLPHFRF